MRTLQQIAELTASGCEIVRVACPTDKDAEALKIIAMKSQIPVIADIHFQPKYVYAAIDAGCGAVRVNPGNIRKFDDQVGVDREGGEGRGRLAAHRRERRIPRPAACSRSTARRRPEALAESAVWEASLFEEHDFHDFKISVKHNDPVVMVQAYRLLAERGDWPLHLGVTEAGPAVPGHDQVGHGVRHSAQRGHRRHDPGIAVGAARRRGQGRPPDPAVARTCESARSRSSPARRAAARRSTCTRSPTTSLRASRA